MTLYSPSLPPTAVPTVASPPGTRSSTTSACLRRVLWLAGLTGFARACLTAFDRFYPLLTAFGRARFDTYLWWLGKVKGPRGAELQALLQDILAWRDQQAGARPPPLLLFSLPLTLLYSPCCSSERARRGPSPPPPRPPPDTSPLQNERTNAPRSSHRRASPYRSPYRFPYCSLTHPTPPLPRASPPRSAHGAREQ